MTEEEELVSAVYMKGLSFVPVSVYNHSLILTFWSIMMVPRAFNCAEEFLCSVITKPFL